VAVDLKLNQDFLVFAQRIEIDLLAAGVFPAGKIEAVGLLKNLADIQIVRPRREYLEADNAALRTEYDLGALAKWRRVGRI
jgi:hypothetical protein